jgi:hypothetical protein
LTTGSATSASSSAMRTSRSVSATFSSVTRPRPRSVLHGARQALGQLVEHALRGCGGAALYSCRATDYKDHVDNAPTIVLILILLRCCMVIAFSSGTEVAMLSVNRYRIRHRASVGERRARLLEKPAGAARSLARRQPGDPRARQRRRLTVATLLAQRTGERLAVPVMMVLLTVVVIVFCELAPKIFAAVHAEASRSLRLHLPGAAVVTWPGHLAGEHLARGFLRLFGVAPHRRQPRRCRR